MSTIDFTTTTRNTIVVLVILVLGLCGLSIHQYSQIQGLVRVDCAALNERQERVNLYTDLGSYWRSVDINVAMSYEDQRATLLQTIDVNRSECDSRRR